MGLEFPNLPALDPFSALGTAMIRDHHFAAILYLAVPLQVIISVDSHF